MPEEYLALVAEAKALEKDGVRLPMAEDEWNPRPDSDNYGMIALEFEADHMAGDNLKTHRAFEGSIDLYSRNKYGGGWVPVIEQLLTKHCESCWRMNRPGYESGSRLYHFEWIFQIEG